MLQRSPNERDGSAMGHLITTLRWHQVAAMAGVPMLAAATTAQPNAPGLGAATTSTTAKSLWPGQSLEGGLEELRELRPLCSSSWATRAASAYS